MCSLASLSEMTLESWPQPLMAIMPVSGSSRSAILTLQTMSRFLESNDRLSSSFSHLKAVTGQILDQLHSNQKKNHLLVDLIVQEYRVVRQGSDLVKLIQILGITPAGGQLLLLSPDLLRMVECLSLSLYLLRLQFFPLLYFAVRTGQIGKRSRTLSQRQRAAMHCICTLAVSARVRACDRSLEVQLVKRTRCRTAHRAGGSTKYICTVRKIFLKYYSCFFKWVRNKCVPSTQITLQVH